MSYPDVVKIHKADRMPMRHGEDCFCSGKRVLSTSLFHDPPLTLQQAEAGLGAREAAALLSGEGLSSEFYYRGQAQACMWLLGYVAV